MEALWKPYGSPVTVVVHRETSVRVFASRMSRKAGMSFFVETQMERITPLSSLPGALGSVTDLF